MENILRERTADRPTKHLAILPPITQMKFSTDIHGSEVHQSRIESLETKMRTVEAANLKLVEIIYQLKNSISNIVSKSNPKDDYSYEGKLSYELESRLKKLESTVESSLLPVNKAIDIPTVSFNQLSGRITSMTNEIEMLNTERTRLENSMLRLTEEMLQLKTQFTVQGDMLVASTDQNNSKTRRLQTEYLTNLELIVDRVNKVQESARQLHNNSVDRVDWNEAVNSVRHELKQIKMRFEEYTHNSDNSIGALAFRVTELAQLLNDEKRFREVEIQRLDLTHQDLIHTQESTRMMLENQLSGLLSDSTAKLMDRETSIRVNVSQKLAEYEKLLLNEKETRNNHEKEIHSKINEVMERANSYQQESLVEMRQIIQANQRKGNEALREIDSGMRLIEQTCEEKLRQHFQATSAEINARKKLQETSKSDVRILEDRIRTATAAMQLAVSGLANRIDNKSVTTTQLRTEMETRFSDFQISLTHNLSDIDSQMQQLTNQMSQLNVNVETRISQATGDLSSELREAMASVMCWQASSSAHLKEMQAVRLSITQELTKMQLALNHFESEIPSLMTIETDERIQAIGDIRQQMESLKIAMSSQSSAKDMNIDQVHDSIRKLAETLRSIKSTFGMKILSEQELRLSQIKDLQVEIKDIENQFLGGMKPLSAIERKRHYFIKLGSQDGEQWYQGPVAFIRLNRWSIYSALKWTKYKNQLIAWKTKALKNKSKRNKKQKGGFWNKSKK